jgi:hypothetical protein
MKSGLTVILILCNLLAFSQFDPAGGEVGSLGVHKNQAALAFTPDSVWVDRGWQQINDTSLGRVSTGGAEDVPGNPDGYTVSLGDGGTVTCYYRQALENRTGFDFAVFENGFEWPGGYFLELAFVEVSSDGKRFVRFPSETKADTIKQTSNLAYMRCEWFHNLAGKHQAPYGTPFDLNELKDSAGIDLNNIHYIRLVDVVGSLNDSLARRDSKGVKINDPWPTPFDAGGFDLDAIGTMRWMLTKEELNQMDIGIGPNPVANGQRLNVYKRFDSIEITSVNGGQSRKYLLGDDLMIDLNPGMYIVDIVVNNQHITQKLCVH